MLTFHQKHAFINWSRKYRLICKGVDDLETNLNILDLSLKTIVPVFSTLIIKYIIKREVQRLAPTVAVFQLYCGVEEVYFNDKMFSSYIIPIRVKDRHGYS